MQRRLFIFSIITFLVAHYLPGQEIENNPILINSLMERMVSKGNKVALISKQGVNGIIPIELFDGNKWIAIPFDYIVENGNSDTIIYDRYSSSPEEIEFDAEGNLWTAAKGGIFKYHEGNWTKYFIDDSNSKARNYTRMCFDSISNIWFAADYFINPRVKDNGIIFDAWVHELYRYNGKDYALMEHDTAYSGVGVDYGLMTTSDGRVWAHIYSANTSKSDNDLYVFSPDGSKEVMTLPSPHEFLKTGVKGNKWVKQIFEDKDNNIWFALASELNSRDDAGLVVLKNDGTWYALSQYDNYPINIIPPGSNIPWDTLYYEAYLTYQASRDRLWVSGVDVLNVIDKNFSLTIPEPFDLNNIVVYSSNKENKKENIESYVQDSLAKMFESIFHQNKFKNFPKLQTWGGGVSSMTETDDGSLWMASLNLGVFRYLDPNTGVSSNQEILKLCEVYPNPVALSEPKISLEFNEAVEYAKLYIFDELGNIISLDELNPANQKADVILHNVTSAGCYFAAVYFNNKIIFRKLIII